MSFHWNENSDSREILLPQPNVELNSVLGYLMVLWNYHGKYYFQF